MEVCDCRFTNSGQILEIKKAHPWEGIPDTKLYQYNEYAQDMGLPIITSTPNLDSHPDEGQRRAFQETIKEPRKIKIEHNQLGLPIIQYRLDHVMTPARAFLVTTQMMREEVWSYEEATDERAVLGPDLMPLDPQVGAKTRRLSFKVHDEEGCEPQSLSVRFVNLNQDVDERQTFDLRTCLEIQAQVKAIRQGASSTGREKFRAETVGKYAEDCELFIQIHSDFQRSPSSKKKFKKNNKKNKSGEATQPK